jgi:hypothetical protein
MSPWRNRRYWRSARRSYFVFSYFRAFSIPCAVSRHNSLHEMSLGVEVHDRLQEARAKCLVYGDGSLDDRPPKLITKARKYESTIKSNPEGEYQRRRLNYEEIAGLDFCREKWDPQKHMGERESPLLGIGPLWRSFACCPKSPLRSGPHQFLHHGVLTCLSRPSQRRSTVLADGVKVRPSLDQ